VTCIADTCGARGFFDYAGFAPHAPLR